MSFSQGKLLTSVSGSQFSDKTTCPDEFTFKSSLYFSTDPWQCISTYDILSETRTFMHPPTNLEYFRVKTAHMSYPWMVVQATISTPVYPHHADQSYSYSFDHDQWSNLSISINNLVSMYQGTALFDVGTIKMSEYPEHTKIGIMSLETNNVTVVETPHYGFQMWGNKLLSGVKPYGRMPPIDALKNVYWSTVDSPLDQKLIIGQNNLSQLSPTASITAAHLANDTVVAVVLGDAEYLVKCDLK